MADPLVVKKIHNVLVLVVGCNCVCVCVALFINPILGNRYGPGVSSRVPMRVPGLPIRDCAGRPDNLVPRSTKLSAMDVTARAIFEQRLVLVPGPGAPICFVCHHALGAHTPTAHAAANSRFPCLFKSRQKISPQ